MLKKLLLATVLLTIVGLIALPFITPSTLHTPLSVATSLVSALASLVTLIIAILLYNKFAIDKPVLEKQTDLVLQLLTEIKSLHFLLEGEGRWLRVRVTDLKMPFWQEHNEWELLFGVDAMDGFDHILKITNNVLLPKEIVRALAFVHISALMFTEYDPKKHFKVTIPTGTKSEDHPDYYATLSDGPITFAEYMQQWVEAVHTIEKWLDQHTSRRVGVNFWYELPERTRTSTEQARARK